MKTKSAKAKGRTLQNYVAQKLNEKFEKEDLFYPAIMGEKGCDVKCKSDFPWAIECKNQEKWNVPEFWRQTEANTKEGMKPLLVVKKNYHEPLVVMRFDDWLEMF